jgi:hypothetical protein
MAKSSFDFDLQFTPDWLKEDPPSKVYANYEGEPEERDRTAGRDADRRGDRRSTRRGRSADRTQRGGRPHREPSQHHERREPRTPTQPAAVEVEFIPDAQTVAGMTEQIRSLARAFPLFGMARMFLMKPERHRVRITSTEKSGPLHQVGEGGPVSLDRTALERLVFNATKDKYFATEKVEREPLKGSFANVARCRLNGAVLGPTNYHTYQAELRRLYEQKFSRRMSFVEFQREIEIVRDPTIVEKWKEDQRTTVVLKLRDNPEQVFASESEAESYFRAHFQQIELHTDAIVEIAGEVSRNLPDRSLVAAIRAEWEKERGFPAKIVAHLRKAFLDAGLHLFKHRKRMQYVSTVRPVPFSSEGGGVVSPGIANILARIGSQPGCTRKQLAMDLLPQDAEDTARSALAADLHWLVHAGHVIEFHDGKLDLPFQKQKPASGQEAAGNAETTPEAESGEPVKSATASQNSTSLSTAPEATQARQPDQ